MNNPSARIVRQAVGAGRWFPAGRQALESMVQGFLRDAKVTNVEGRIVGGIAPHAGYVYSGKVAGYTFRALQENARVFGAPETVVILGFSHRSGFRGVALMDGDAMATPLGEVALDVEAARSLTNRSDRIRLNYAPHYGEHSAENEIPFTQVALPSAKLVVALIGDHDPLTLDALASALSDLAARKKIVVIASTDLLHDPDYDKVKAADKVTLERIGKLDMDGLAGSWSFDNQVCCGIGPVLTLMRYAKAQGCRQGTLLFRCNTGDDFPESRGNWVVGYGSVVFAVPK